MRCDWAECRLLLHAHGELRGWARVSLDRHLRHCPSCRETREQFIEERRALAGCLLTPPSLRVSDRIALELGVRRPSPGPHVVVSRRLPILFLALVAVLAGSSAVAFVQWRSDPSGFFSPYARLFHWNRATSAACPYENPNAPKQIPPIPARR